MVLWEITLGTAYFLGLKRTYRLALKIQRRIISPKFPKLRQFAHRRTRAAFDVALKVHRNIQHRDLEVGRNLGNWILRWLDRMKPSAEISGPRDGNFCPKRNLNASTRKRLTNSPNKKPLGGSQKFSTLSDRDSSRHFFASSKFSSITTMMRPTHGNDIQYRRLSFVCQGEFRQDYNFRFGHGVVIRKDIMQWLQK